MDKEYGGAQLKKSKEGLGPRRWPHVSERQGSFLGISPQSWVSPTPPPGKAAPLARRAAQRQPSEPAPRTNMAPKDLNAPQDYPPKKIKYK